MGILSVIRKEMLEIIHDRTMLLVLMVFPLFIMLFMGSSFRSVEIRGLPIGVTGPLNTTFSSTLLGDLNESKAFNLESFESEESAMDAFRNGQLRAVIIIPEDFEAALAAGSGAEIRIAMDNSDLALEQAVVAAMSSVVQASSANITRSYVTAAWDDLRVLNSSASALAEDIGESRENMENTKATLAGIRAEMTGLDIGRLGRALDSASVNIANLQALLAEQHRAVENLSADNEQLLNDTSLFLYNASFALNESIETVGDTHDRLVTQIENLNDTVNTLNASIIGLRAVRATVAGSACNVTAPAIDLTIISLESMMNSTQQQMIDAWDEVRDLEELNVTLNQFGYALANYSVKLEEARARQNETAGLVAALDTAASSLNTINASFSSARSDVTKLGILVTNINSTMAEMEETLDGALEQTASVDSLILSLQRIVEIQTGKDPERIATPLSVNVEPQYTRESFVDFLMPQVIAITLLLSCFLLVSISFVREKTKRTVVRALLAPGGLSDIVIGKITTMVFISFVQVAAILLVATIMFGVRGPSDITMLVAGTVISALVLSSIGMLVGFSAKTESAAIQGCLLLAIPMLFLGNIIFSPDLLPQYTQVLQQLLPLAHVTNIYKVVLITSGNPAVDIAALGSYFILLAVMVAYIVIKRRDIKHYQ